MVLRQGVETTRKSVLFYPRRCGKTRSNSDHSASIMSLRSVPVTLDLKPLGDLEFSPLNGNYLAYDVKNMGFEILIDNEVYRNENSVKCTVTKAIGGGYSVPIAMGWLNRPGRPYGWGDAKTY